MYVAANPEKHNHCQGQFDEKVELVNHNYKEIENLHSS